MEDETEIDEEGESFNKRWRERSPTEKCSIEIVWAGGGSEGGLTEERFDFIIVCEVRGGELMEGEIGWRSESVLEVVEEGWNLRWRWDLRGRE